LLETRVILPLLIFAAMVAASLWLVWRVVVAGGRARREKAVGHAAAETARRCEALLTDIGALVDEVRRRKAPPADVQPALVNARAALERSARETASISRSVRWASQVTALAGDIDRAARAVELVLHGTELMADSRARDPGEGEVEVKRGYLNLVHARDAIRERRDQILAATGSR
jgi:hypothetical protein